MNVPHNPRFGRIDIPSLKIKQQGHSVKWQTLEFKRVGDQGDQWVDSKTGESAVGNSQYKEMIDKCLEHLKSRNKLRPQAGQGQALLNPFGENNKWLDAKTGQVATPEQQQLAKEQQDFMALLLKFAQQKNIGCLNFILKDENKVLCQASVTTPQHPGFEKSLRNHISAWGQTTL